MKPRARIVSTLIAVSVGAALVVPHEQVANASGESGACPPEMVEVAGDYCPSIEHTCLRWLHAERGEPQRCAEYGPSPSCSTTVVAKHFCIDRYEFPNEVGKAPLVMRSWQQAQDTCRGLHKRLCGDSEWTLACEGPQRLPYPYGRKRDASACNIDHPQVQVDANLLADPRTRVTEVARLWRGEASGSHAECKSAHGVFDLTGNVDEWVVNESGKPYRSGLKGGYWGRVRDACRPMTTAHGETFPFYQTGFRCCSDTRS
jgi:formylglycine-generating enzyme